MQPSVPLLQVVRGGRVESLHRGALVVVEDDRPVLVRGDPAWVVFYRSTSKPLQALVGVTSGAADRYGLDDASLAIATGSHSAGPAHLAAVRRILERAGIDESCLGCGGHWSIDPAIAARQRAEVDAPPRVWSNCSGKHALMLAAAKHMGAPLETYLDLDHPVQRTIREHVARLGSISTSEVVAAVDGCGAPAFGLPLSAMARSLARFGAPDGLPPDLQAAARRLAAAMHAHPEMVGGVGRFDTVLMQGASTPLLSKGGAEGVLGVAVPSRRLGLAIKVEDGSDRGYRWLALELLHRLGVLSPEARDVVARAVADPEIRTVAGRPCGRLEALLHDGPPPGTGGAG